jgi:hypothetical protein
MKLIKPVLWTMFGVVIGIVATAAASRVDAQQRPREERIHVSSYLGADRSGMFGVYFVKDSKSGGCWIGTRDGSHWNALSVAPPTACE